MMNLYLYNRNKRGETEYRGTLYISFEMIPMNVSELNPVGIGREQPNLDPVLPEPAGRLNFASISGGLLFGGFFCLSGVIKE